MNLKLHKKGSPVLAQKAVPVFHGEDVSALLNGMWEVLRQTGGIGLAANQVGSLQRVIIMNVGGNALELINPIITVRRGGKFCSTEGCLSFPGERVRVLRDRQVTIEGFTRDWKPICRKLKELSAFCAQHETDHLDGKTIL